MIELVNVLDHYDDNGLLLRKEFADRGVPAIIKTAADLSSNPNPEPDDYALVVNTDLGTQYKYPIVDAGNTIASAVYFSEHSHSLPEEFRKEAAQKLDNALVSFGFSPPEELTKTAAMELGYSGEGEDQSLMRLFGFGRDENQYEELKGAFDKCSPRGKRRLMMQVKEAGVLSEHLVKEASGDFEGLGEVVDYTRADYGSDLALSIDLRKLATLNADTTSEIDSLLEKCASLPPEDFVEELYAFDTRNNLTHLYGKVIPDPFASVFGTEVEKTAESVDSLDIGGREYAPSDIVAFADTGAGPLEEAFGKEFAEQFAGDPVHVLDSLPITHKQAIARMIDERQT
jgi:hypothetical protein